MLGNTIYACEIDLSQAWNSWPNLTNLIVRFYDNFEIIIVQLEDDFTDWRIKANGLF